MPYISAIHRRALALGTPPSVAGELNYEITTLLALYVSVKGLNYQTLNDALGALEGAKAEFYRRVVAPYEDEKIQENGDVY